MNSLNSHVLSAFLMEEFFANWNTFNSGSWFITSPTYLWIRNDYLLMSLNNLIRIMSSKQLCCLLTWRLGDSNILYLRSTNSFRVGINRSLRRETLLKLWNLGKSSLWVIGIIIGWWVELSRLKWIWRDIMWMNLTLRILMRESICSLVKSIWMLVLLVRNSLSLLRGRIICLLLMLLSTLSQIFIALVVFLSYHFFLVLV
jgi:hypothetical protein